MKKYKYDKLVRDKIPEIIESKGKKCSWVTLNDQEFNKKLEQKLDEEVLEFHQDNNIEELADILEVILALALELGTTPTELEAVRNNKYNERGGFAEHIFLLSVEEP